MKQDITYEIASALLRYDEETGKLFWLPRTAELFQARRNTAASACKTWNARYAGKEAFTAKDDMGYYVGAVFDRRYLAHRIIWLLHTGGWPDGSIDHIDGDPGNNSVSNLRCVSHSENMRNVKRQSRNKSGISGVCWSERHQKWRAYITVDGAPKSLGSFDDYQAAVTRRRAAEEEFGYHPNHGRAA